MANGKITHVYKRVTRDATSKVGIIDVGGEKYEFTPKQVGPDLLADADAVRSKPPLWDKLQDKEVEFELKGGEIIKGSIRKRK